MNSQDVVEDVVFDLSPAVKPEKVERETFDASSDYAVCIKSKFFLQTHVFTTLLDLYILLSSL